VRITRAGVITGILFSLSGVTGAALTSESQLEVSKQSVRSTTQNDTPADVIAEASVAGNVASGAVSQLVQCAGLAHPVDVGDNIYLHQTSNGTAFTSQRSSVTIFVEQL
jgi:hypothetical protein